MTNSKKESKQENGRSEPKDRELLDALYNRYALGGGKLSGLRASIYFSFKKYGWTFVVASAHIVKRAFDIAATSVLLLVLSPLFLLTAIAIKIDDPGPALYNQTRVGKWGRTFTMHKFRSMVMNADKLKDQLLEQDESGGVIFKMKRDPRVTRVGRIIRKLSIDELPQLWNVLKGDMSLVGPRPPVPREVAEYRHSDRKRLNAIPGITCLWQVSGRSDIDFEGQVGLDVEYIESQSFWKDIKILLRTIPAVLLGKGAY